MRFQTSWSIRGRGLSFTATHQPARSKSWAAARNAAAIANAPVAAPTAAAAADALLLAPSASTRRGPSHELRQCAALSAALQISVRQALRMATSTPQVLTLAPDEARRRCGQLQRLLGVNAYEACELLVARPALLLLPDGKGALACAGGLPALVAKAQELAVVLETAPASAMNALCRAAPQELAVVMGMGPARLQQQVADLQAAIFPRPHPQAPPHPQAATAAQGPAPLQRAQPAAAPPSAIGAADQQSSSAAGGPSTTSTAAAAGAASVGVGLPATAASGIIQEAAAAGSSSSSIGAGAGEVVSSSSSSVGAGAGEVVSERGADGDAVRRRLVCSLLLKWPGLLATPPRQVATNMVQLVRRLRLPPRRVAVLAARVPLLLAEPLPTVEERLAALCGVLRLGRQQLLQLLVATPLLLRQAPGEVQERVHALHRLLALPRDAALELVYREPNLLRYAPRQMRHKLTRVAAALKVCVRVAAALVVRVPELLLASPSALSARVSDLGLVLGVPPVRVVQMAMRLPRLLLYDVGKLRAHYEGQSALWASTGGTQDAGSGGMQQLVVQHPWLLLLPAPAVTARAAAVAAVLQVAPAVVLSMARRTPVVLARTAEWVQITMDIITQELKVAQDVAVAVLQRVPVVLAYDHATARTKCKRLRRLAETHPYWEEQLVGCLPDELATCLRYGSDTFGRLQWLAEAGLQGEVSMVDAAVRDPLLFLRCFPAADRRAAALQRMHDQRLAQAPLHRHEPPKDAKRADAGHDTVALASGDGASALRPGKAEVASNVCPEEVEEVMGDTTGGETTPVPLSRWEADEQLGAREAAERPRKEEGDGRKAGKGGRRKWVGGGRPDSTDFL